MAYHPRENWDPRTRTRGYSRRDFIKMAGALGIALPGFSSLAACGNGDAAGTADLAIGTPSDPVAQPLIGEAIGSGLDPESGPLRIYNWADYINPDILPRFTEETGIDIELTTFYNEEEAIQKLSSGETEFDVWFPVASTVAKAVAGGLIQPINHDYLPNLANVWPSLQDPFYDEGAQYSVPYTVYLTWIGWRTDMVDSADVEDADQPWDVFWNEKYAGIAGFYDDYRETLSAAMFRQGVTDPNTASESELEAAGDSLIELVDLMNIRYTIDGAYTGIPEGRFGVHHAWSGDMVAAPFYYPEDGDPSVTRFLWPARSGTGGLIANDTIAVVTGAEHPVSGHTFLNWMLDADNAAENFGWNGYQPPQNSLDPETLVADEWVVEYLEPAIVREDDYQNDNGHVPIQRSAEQEATWLDTWSRVQGTA